MELSALLDGLLEVKYDPTPRQHQDELREKFEREFSNAALVVICIVLAAALLGWTYWIGLPDAN